VGLGKPASLGLSRKHGQFRSKKKESMDSELQECFNLALRNGINLFDTADSYGTGKLNGQSERLLGRFIRGFEG